MNALTDISAETDIAAVWAESQDRVTWADYHRLMKSGVASEHLFFDGDFGFGTAEVAIKNGRWRKMFRGDEAIVLPVEGADGSIADLVAFRMETPRVFSAHDGSVPLLGYESLAKAAHYGEPLTVHECPLDWLKAGREGVVILDWEHAWSFWFAGIPHLMTKSQDFALRLLDRLERPFPVPDVRFSV